MISFLTHPVTTFFGGAILALIGIGILLSAKMEKNKTAQFVKNYRTAMNKAGESGPPPAKLKPSNVLPNSSKMSEIESTSIIRPRTYMTKAPISMIQSQPTTVLMKYEAIFSRQQKP